MWAILEKYRERYNLDAEIPGLASLKRSIDRRRTRRAAVNRRLNDLMGQMTAAKAELKAIDSEIAGSKKAGALLLEDIIDRVRIREGETWSPTPILGFRMWWIHNGIAVGAKVPWFSPSLDACCLSHIPGEDIPHSGGKCGPPACGIYATKDLDSLSNEVSFVRSAPLVGLVALTGKVVEHERGYRAQSALVVAAAGIIDGHRYATDDSAEIAQIFSNPISTAAALGCDEAPMADDYLKQRKEANNTWTWAKN